MFTIRVVVLLGLMADVGWAQEAAESTARLMVKEMQEGKWSQAVQRFDATMATKISADQLSNIWHGLETQAGKLLTCDEAKVVPKSAAKAVYLNCKFEHSDWLIEIVIDEKAKVSGLWFKPAPWRPAPVHNEAYSESAVEVGPAKLRGVVSVPNGTGPFPAVVLVHGSGPNDGDETVGPNRPFKDLADGLARRGIAVLRYDKRTHAPGVTLPEKLTVAEETVDDARAGIALLGAIKGVDGKRIFVAGHSLGGMLAPRIAKGTKAAGLVLLAAPARPIEELLVEQIRANKPLLLPQAEAMRKQVQDPALKPEDVIQDPMGSKVTGAYFLDLRGYKPAEAAAKLGLPVLVLQGGHDIQVRRADYDLYAKALAGKKNAKLVLYPMLTHLFIEGDGNLTDYQKAGHVHEDVIRDMAEFVSGKKRSK